MPLAPRTNSPSDRVTVFEKGFHNVDSQIAVGTSDENFASRSDSWHFTGGI